MKARATHTRNSGRTFCRMSRVDATETATGTELEAFDPRQRNEAATELR